MERAPGPVRAAAFDDDALEGGFVQDQVAAQLPGAAHGRGSRQVPRRGHGGPDPALEGTEPDRVHDDDALVGTRHAPVAGELPEAAGGPAPGPNRRRKLDRMGEERGQAAGHPGVALAPPGQLPPEREDHGRRGADVDVALGQVEPEIDAQAKRLGKGGALAGKAGKKGTLRLVAGDAHARGAHVPALVDLPAGVSREGPLVAGEGHAGEPPGACGTEHPAHADREHPGRVLHLGVGPQAGGGGVHGGRQLDGEPVGLPAGHQEACRVRGPAPAPPVPDVRQALAEEGERLVAESAIHGAPPVLDPPGPQGRGQVVLGECAGL